MTMAICSGKFKHSKVVSDGSMELINAVVCMTNGILQVEPADVILGIVDTLAGGYHLSKPQRVGIMNICTRY